MGHNKYRGLLANNKKIIKLNEYFKTNGGGVKKQFGKKDLVNKSYMRSNTRK
ncbi:MAG: hypothetical protein OHK0053_27420 [Microscillaceae bacterium]